MTVSTTTRRAGPFYGNGVTTSFPFTFKVFDKTNVQVVLTNTATGIQTTLVLDSDYSVTVNADQVNAPGGSITYPISGSPMPSGYTLAVVGSLPYTQTTTLPAGGNFSPTVIEQTFDRTEIQIQQLVELAGRSFVAPAGIDTTQISTSLPYPAANKLIAWNPTATGLQNVDPTTLASIIAYGTANADIFTGTGAQTVFALSANPGAQANLDVSVGGVTQLPGADYTWTSGTTLTFTSAPPNGAKILVRYLQGLAQGTTDSAASSFTQGSAGAVTRTVALRLRDTLNVKDFGAAGDGVTTDTTAIQAAFDAVRLAGGGSVYFPPGTYIVDRSIRIGAKTRAFGAGASSLIKAKQSGYVGANGGTYATQNCQLFQNYNFSASVLTDSDIEVEDLAFDWGTVTISGGGAHSVTMRMVDRVAVRRVFSMNGENVTALLGCRDTVVDSCVGLNVKNCFFDHWDGASSAKVINCVGRVTSGTIAQGIQFTGTGSYSEGLSSTDAVVVGCSLYGVRNTGSSAAIIANANQASSSVYRLRSIGNYIEDCDIGIAFAGTGGHHLSLGDTLRNVTKLPIFFQNDGTAAPSNSRVIDAHLIDCNHLAGNIAMVSVNGANNVVKGLRVTNTGAVAYQQIVWLPPASSGCVVQIDAAATGTVSRVQNDGTSNTVVDQTLYSDIAALDSSWTAYTPTISATSGAFTAVAGSGRYKQVGKTVFFTATATITTNGTAAGSLLISLPAAAKAANTTFGSGRDATAGGLCLWFNASTTNAYVQTTGGAYPGADGRSISISGSYEAV